jgi:DDE superfamily endonuclease
MYSEDVAEDGAPCHKSKKVMDVLKRYKEEFSIMDWLGNSSDLNPIENRWSLMKQKLKNNKKITSLPKLIDAFKTMWVTDMAKLQEACILHSLQAPACHQQQG